MSDRQPASDNPVHRLQPVHLVALVILLAALARMVFGDSDGRFDQTTLLYLFGVAAVLLLSRAKTFQFGDLKIDLEIARLRDEVEEAKLTASIAEDTVRHAVAEPVVRVPDGRAAGELKAAAAEVEPLPGVIHDDPWKGVFGGQSIDKASGRMLSAEVKALGNTPGWYGVTLSVTALPGAAPLEGTVRFFLHDSFVNDRPLVRVAAGQAVLHLKAWGAFTVGALADEGACRLELDLAGLESAPMEFRLR